MAFERLGQAINYALLADKRGGNIEMGSSHPELLVPVISSRTIKDLGIVVLAVYKMASTISLGVAGYDLFKAQESFGNQDYPQALAWAGKGLMVGGLSSLLIAGTHWGQTKLAPKSDPLEKYTNSIPYQFNDFYYSNHLSRNPRFVYPSGFRRFLPFMKGTLEKENRADIQELTNISSLHKRLPN